MRSSLFARLLRLADVLIPRFITEDAAADKAYCGHCDEPHYFPVCAMRDVEPGEVFAGIITMKCFNLFGIALFARYDERSVRPWANPHDKV